MVSAAPTAKVSDSSAKWEVFDFDTNWSKVLPVLDDPLALRALNAGMTAWCAKRRTAWDPEDGPWSHSYCTFWLSNAQTKFQASDQYAEWLKWRDANGYSEEEEDYDEDKECEKYWEKYWEKYDELQAQFYPKPRTPDWYRCTGACHHLAAWNCAIGELVFPDMAWGVVIAEKHSTAHGWTSSREVFVDILWGKDHTYAEIKDVVCEGEWRILTDDIELLEKEALSPNC